MKTLFALLLLLKVTVGFSQQAVVVNEKQNIVYCGIQNPLTAVVKGFPCKAITLRTTNGKIEKTGCGRFSYTPDHTGTARLEIWILQNKKQVKKDEWRFDVRKLPDPVAMLTVYAREEQHFRPPKGDTVYKSWLMPFSGVRAILPNPDYEAIYQIVSYTISAIRQTKVLFSQVNTGAQFEVKMIPYFDSLQAGDQLIFSNIICTGPSLCNRQNPKPIKFYVDE